MATNFAWLGVIFLFNCSLRVSNGSNSLKINRAFLVAPSMNHCKRCWKRVHIIGRRDSCSSVSDRHNNKADTFFTSGSAKFLGPSDYRLKSSASDAPCDHKKWCKNTVFCGLNVDFEGLRGKLWNFLPICDSSFESTKKSKSAGGTLHFDTSQLDGRTTEIFDTNMNNCFDAGNSDVNRECKKSGFRKFISFALERVSIYIKHRFAKAAYMLAFSEISKIANDALKFCGVAFYSEISTVLGAITTVFFIPRAIEYVKIKWPVQMKYNGSRIFPSTFLQVGEFSEVSSISNYFNSCRWWRREYNYLSRHVKATPLGSIFRRCYLDMALVHAFNSTETVRKKMHSERILSLKFVAVASFLMALYIMMRNKWRRNSDIMRRLEAVEAYKKEAARFVKHGNPQMMNQGWNKEEVK